MEKLKDIIVSDDIQTANDPLLEGYLLHAWCPQGRCLLNYNNQPMLFKAGDCMIIPRRGDRLHDIQPEADFKVEIIYVTQSFIELSTPMSNYGMRGGLALFDNPIMHLDEEQQRVCALNFDYIRSRLKVHKHHFHRDAMINAIQCMIIDFYDFHVEQNGESHITLPQADLMERFQAMLDRGDFRQHRDVAFYADRLCVTPKYLSEVSRKVSGYSAGHWITRHTALDISRMLRNRALSLEEISDFFGFSSLNYFIRFVQKNLGLPPSDFRE